MGVQSASGRALEGVKNKTDRGTNKASLGVDRYKGLLMENTSNFQYLYSDVSATL